MAEVRASRTSAGDGSERASSHPAWSYEQTRILPEALDSLPLERSLNILEVGPAEPRTIDFLRRFRCQLYVAELFNPSVSGGSLSSPQAFLDTVKGVRFDLCLLWDFINYPDDTAFADFIECLAEHVHESTRLYTIGAYSSQVPLKAYRYAIHDDDRLAIRPVGGVVPQPRSRNDVTRIMRRFMVHRAALRRDNRLELVLRSVRSPYG